MNFHIVKLAKARQALLANILQFKIFEIFEIIYL